MENKQLLIAIVTLVTFTFYSLNPMAYDEWLEMEEEEDKHITTLTKNHITHSTLPKNRR